MALELSRVKQYYDRFGSKQDAQGFYEDTPIERLIEHAAFDRAANVFELGCGTGKFAHRLLDDHLPSHGTYVGVDVSDTMVRLATERLAPFGPRARVSRSEGGTQIPLSDESVERVVSLYVLDLLPDEEIAGFFREAHRALAPGGLLCCVSLGRGTGLGSKIVGGLWSAVYHAAPMLVGGCRPISFSRYFEDGRWEIRFRETLAPYGVPSEVFVATPVTPSATRPSMRPPRGGPA